MHRHIAALWIFVGRGHACMPGLITGYDNPGGVCKIPDAGILKAVEPIFVAPIQSLADFFPPSAEYLAAWLCHASPHLVAEDITLARMAEEIYVEHQFKDFVIESHLSVSFVLAVLIPSGLKLKNPYNRLIIRISSRLLRKERDSNPRRCDPQRFSRPPHSTTLPSFRVCCDLRLQS